MTDYEQIEIYLYEYPKLQKQILPVIQRMIKINKDYKNALKVALEFISFVNSSDRADGALSALALNKIQEITKALEKASQ